MNLTILLIILSLFACSKNSKESLKIEESIVFGMDYAECGGDCAHLFKLENGKLYSDDGINYITNQETQKFTFKSTTQSDSCYQIALPIKTSFPEKLWNSSESRFGEPNAHDQGGITVEMTRDGITRRWYLDTQIERLPDYLKPYAQSIKDSVTELIKNCEK